MIQLFSAARVPWLWALLLVGLPGGLSLALAQPARLPARRDYIQVPVADNVEDRLKDLLRQAQGRRELDNFIQSIHPEQFKLDEKDLNRLDLNNPKLRKHIADAVRDSADKFKLDPQKAEDIQRALKQFDKTPPHGKQPEPPDQPPPDLSKPAPPDQPQSGAAPPAEPAAPEDPLADWMRDLMEDLEYSRWGKSLQNSPAVQQSIIDLQESLLDRRDVGFRPDTSRFGKLADHLRLPDNWSLAPLENSWLKIQDMPLPSLPRPNISFGGWRGPGLPAVSASGAGTALLWVLLLIAVGILLWQVLARIHVARTAAAGTPWRLGPWPVNPARVSSRDELVRAFEYLSLLLLGRRAYSWNHRDIAEGLSEQAQDRRAAVDQLALLYEKARYAPADEPLSAEALAAARRNLCLLAGVHSE